MMAMVDITDREWLLLAEQRQGREALFLYTPLCGTCKLAEQMLDIVLETGPVLPICKMNINYAPHLREQWKITSVPCLVILQDGNPVDIHYAMHSVVSLYDWMKA